MSQAQELEDRLHDLLQEYLRACGAMASDDVLSAWVVAFSAEIADKPNEARYGHGSPRGQRYHVSHGLTAGLFAAFQAGVGAVASEDGEEGM